MEVAELEEMARAAGLLGESARIANSKPFRKAKELLRVASKREGFGPGSKSFWCLSPAYTPSGSIDALPTERAPMQAEGAYAGGGRLW